MMTRKFRITITKDEEFDTRFHLSVLPFGYRAAPLTMRKLAFVSQRSFGSENDAVREARALFGIMVFKRKTADMPLGAVVELKAD